MSEVAKKIIETKANLMDQYTDKFLLELQKLKDQVVDTDDMDSAVDGVLAGKAVDGGQSIDMFSSQWFFKQFAGDIMLGQETIFDSLFSSEEDITKKQQEFKEKIKKYLTNEWFWDLLEDKIITKKVFDMYLSWYGEKWDVLFGKLQKARELFVWAKTMEDLSVLQKEFNLYDEDVDVSDADFYKDNPDYNWSSLEILSDRRQAVLNNIDAIIAQDKKTPIRYKWGGRKSMKDWLDCWWLVVYALQHAWLKVSGNSRSLFQDFDTTKLDVDTHGAITTDTSHIQEWDVMFWDSLDPSYKWSTGEIPPVKKDNKNYRIHHIAFVKSIDRARWIVHTVESNWANWVTENEVSVSDWLTKKWNKKSSLHVAHVDYDALETMNSTAVASLETLPWWSMVA